VQELLRAKKMQDELNFEDSKLKSILGKTVELFYEFGIRNLNMDDISRKLNISKKTLYQYVKSKEDLIEKLFYYDDMRWGKKISQIKVNELNAIDTLIQVSLLVFDELSRLDPKLKFEMKKYYEPIFNDFMQKRQTHIFNQISQNILKGIKEGLYREDVNVELSAGLYVRNLVDMHNKDYCFGENITFAEVFEALFENHIRAISTPDGIVYFEKQKSEIIHFKNNN
jgi:TetR/AcrR family transcriptional regulator, cholesterol catabolism regulator